MKPKGFQHKLIALFVSIASLCSAQVTQDSLIKIGGISYKINDSIPYSGEVTFVNYQGKTLQRWQLRNGLKNGEFLQYTEDGENILLRLNYKNGLKDGPYTRYSPPKVPHTTGNYISDLRNGIWREWDGDLLILEENYKNDTLNGSRKTWYQNGQLNRNETYKKGNLFGICYYYHENGNLLLEKEYIRTKRLNYSKNYYYNGNIKDHAYYYGYMLKDSIYRSYHEDGSLRQRVFFKNNQMHGESILISKDSIITKTYYNNGYLDGMYTSRAKNGQILEKKHYKNDLIVDTSYTWHLNGVMASKTYYKEGKKHGVDISWSKDERISSITTYSLGKKNGVKIMFYPNGLAQSKMFYFEGKLHGPSKEFTDTGEKTRSYYYTKGKLTLDTTFINGKIQYTYYAEGVKDVITIYYPITQDENDYQELISKAKTAYWYTVNPEGQILRQCQYNRGVIVGKDTHFYPNGIKKEEHNYSYSPNNSFGIKEGASFFWDTEGKLVRKEIWKEDQIIFKKVF